jgi:DNA topoisomerase III
MPRPFKEVIICEKGSQARLFASMLKLKNRKMIKGTPAVFYDQEGGIAVVHQSGHLLGFMPPEFYEPSLQRSQKGWHLDVLPVIPDMGQWRYQLVKNPVKKFDDRNKALLAGIKWALVECGSPGEISLAVDNDKEGELLGWEVLDYLKVIKHPNITRMLYSALTEKAIRTAYDNKDPGSKWYNRYQAGLARAMADWMMGMNVTMALTVANEEYLPPFDPINSGRVIYAIAHIIALRQEAIEAFSPKDFFKEHVTFVTDKGEKYIGLVQYNKGKLDPEEARLFDKAYADKVHNHVLAKKQGVVEDYNEKDKKTSPPLGFSRTNFERHMIKKHRMSLDAIGDAMQALYSDKALITYPRVEVVNLDTSMHKDMPGYIAAMAHNLMSAPQLSEKEQAFYGKVFKYLNPALKSKIWKDGIDDDESHHAIIPTDKKGDFKTLKADEFLVYRELADRLLVQFLPDFEYAETVIITDVGGVKFKTTGKTTKRMGWKALSKDVMEEADDENDVDPNGLPILNINQAVGVHAAETKVSKTTQPKPYTEDELLGVMLKPNRFVKNKAVLKSIGKLQIGTGGTRKDHVANLKKKGFVEHVKTGKGKAAVTRLHPTIKLMVVDKIAPDYFKTPEVSAYWEDAFIKIEKGELSLDLFYRRQRKLVQRFFDELKSGKFRINEPMSKVFHRCGEPCGGYLFFKPTRKKDFSLWQCGKCKESYIDDNGQVGRKLPPRGEGGAAPKGERPKWVPSATSKGKECPACKKGKVHFKKLRDKKFDVWSCVDCDASFFDDKGAIGSQLGKK